MKHKNKHLKRSNATNASFIEWTYEDGIHSGSCTIQYRCSSNIYTAHRFVFLLSLRLFLIETMNLSFWLTLYIHFNFSYFLNLLPRFQTLPDISFFFDEFSMENQSYFIIYWYQPYFALLRFYIFIHMLQNVFQVFFMIFCFVNHFTTFHYRSFFRPSIAISIGTNFHH